MRIVFVISSLRIGGAQKVLAILASHFVDCGHEIYLLTQAPEDSDEIQIRPEVLRHQFGQESNSGNMFDGLKSNLIRLRELRAICSKINADVVVSFLGETNILTILATRFLGVKIVVNERSNLKRESVGMIWSLLRYLTYRFADQVIANTEDSHRVLERYVSPCKLRLLENPVEISSSGEKKFKGNDEKVLLLTVSRCSSEKGIDVLLHAIQYLVKYRTKNFSLRVVGDGPCLGQLQDLAESLDVAPMIDWRGRDLDVEKHYRDADLFVLASRYEGMPNVLLEATAHGIPLIATESSSAVRRFIEEHHNGILVPIDSPEQLGQALDDLISGPERREIFAKNCREASSKLGGDSVLMRWQEALLFSE